jgi:hypothetical protein
VDSLAKRKIYLQLVAGDSFITLSDIQENKST